MIRFVIIEDEIRIREGIRRLLSKLDEDNEIAGEAEDGMEGLELIRRVKPDVIITDIRMPVMDGLEMLESLYEEGCRAKAIVLSAYSEFEYARQALRLGVTEYILKPVVMTDFFEAVEHVKKAWEKEQKMKAPQQIGSLSQVVKNVLMGDLVIEENVAEYLEHQFGIGGDMPISLLVVYFEKWEDRNPEKFIRRLKMILAEKPMLKYCIQEDERQKEIRLFLYDYGQHHHVKRWIQSHFLQKDSSAEGIAMGWTEVQNIGELKKGYEELGQYMEWNILLGEEIIISYPEILQVQTSLCIYPLEIEEEMKIAVCSENHSKIEKSAKRFYEYFLNSQVLYEPQKVKECYVRFIWAVFHFAKEMGTLDFEDLEQRKILERIAQTKTRQGLEDTVDGLIGRIKRQEKEIDNLNVKRAVAIIHEFYRSGITLDEIAMKLGITPEYLGMQFHQEMGVNFSTYIRTLRINKAKELLIRTQLKLYEIAEQVGYSDSKYFSKVFKAETGQLPAEYRKTYK